MLISSLSMFSLEKEVEVVLILLVHSLLRQKLRWTWLSLTLEQQTGAVRALRVPPRVPLRNSHRRVLGSERSKTSPFSPRKSGTYLFFFT